MDRDIHVLSYNIGLTNRQVHPAYAGNFLYKKTKELKNVILTFFTSGADTSAI